jgi:hypothetical protein
LFRLITVAIALSAEAIAVVLDFVDHSGSAGTFVPTTGKWNSLEIEPR